MGNVASRPTAGAVKAGKRGKVPKSSGGAASWFLFILKVRIAVKLIALDTELTVHLAHWRWGLHRICRGGIRK